MLVIELNEGVIGQWLAEHLARMLGQEKSFPEDDGPPWHYDDRDKWQLDRGNNYWLFTEGNGFKAMARYSYNREKLNGFADDLRLRPEIISVTVESL